MKNLFNIKSLLCLLFVTSFYTYQCSAKEIDLYSSFGVEVDTLGDGVEEFVDELEGISRFNINIKSPADIGIGQSDLLEKVAEGAIDMAIVVFSAQNRGDDDLNLEIDLYGESFPFGLQMDEYLSWHYNGEGLEILEGILKDDGDGVTVLPVIASTGQAAGMFKGEVDRARFQDESDVFKMRSFGFGQEVLREAYPNIEFISAVPGSSGVADILNGFAVDLEGAEFINPQIDYKTFFLDAEPNVQELGVTHYYINAWQSPVTLHYLIINKKFFNNLNDKKRSLIETAAYSSAQKSHARLLRKQGNALKNIEELGITISKFDDDILNALTIR